MAGPDLRYDRMVEEALRGVVRQTLNEVAQHGLPPEHHFYVTFETIHKGVEIPDYLRQRYPSEMTIVLQHQFYGLKVTDTQFSVTLSFNNTPERLVIPFEAIRIFADPSVSFALQFEGPDSEPASGEGDDFDEAALDALIAETEKALTERSKNGNAKGKPAGPAAKGGKKTAASSEDEAKKGEVVSLADFRKKQTDKEK
jgi:hypothetical protein